ncbi:spore coat protein CotF [Pullulanibacillus pueri]|uniref:Spore coat protein n=1 Tax=Pullulanibacillus pueri TaxID=1437324 RepID=A0A8J3EN49_9BACL|nr:spore coat protein [Pullulanibacillus pueri]MBM7684024.1 spore coat protein CotF [Pullulanibacillus pueri]GGH85054.1 spore coat protein [Pullulanibacillus pueri]
MQLAAHEVHELHELTLSCVNSITNMGYFIQHIQNPELKAIVEKHLPYHIRDYDIKVEYLSKVEGAQTQLPIPELNQNLQSYTTSPVSAYPPVTPRTSVQDFNDREMATAYLLTLKRAGREYAWAAMELSQPQIRLFCQNAFMMSCNHAYEVWQWMVQQGFYPLEPADPAMTTKIGNVYGIVPPQ